MEAEDLVLLDAYSELKFSLTRIILHNAVCGIISTLCSFVLLCWEQCRIELIRAPVFRDKDADVENGLEDTGRGKGKLGRSERVARTYIHYQM